jgi:hypothetical protein
MRKSRHLSVSTATEIESLVLQHRELSDLFRARAKDSRVSNRADLLQVAEFIEEKSATLREHAHRFGPTERAELIVTAYARLKAARLHLTKIEATLDARSAEELEAV